jgi:SNF2 family DNA or RNA helicase
MKHQGKAIEIIGSKEVLGKKIVWIKYIEDASIREVSWNELQESSFELLMADIRLIALATKIKSEIAQKSILAPYESSLIPLPHQILVLEKVMQSQQNRFLLADEVGMGKTIETGLILKELQLRDELKRVLVIVPKSSMLQWQSEMKEHFNEVFHIYDSEMITSLARTFSNINADEEFNFWRQHHKIIVSTDALKPLEKRQGWTSEKVDEYNKYRLQAVLNADFDLVIIDEAHKMGGASPTVSRYLLAQSLCNSVANVLLLTATPHRGKADHFRRVLQLLDPDAFDGEGLPKISELEPYVIRTEKRLAVDYEGKKLFNERQTIKLNIELDEARHYRQIQLYKDVTRYVINGFNRAKKNNNTAVGLIMILFQRLASSSTAAILSALEGRLNRLQQNEESSLEDFAEEIDSLDEEAAPITEFNHSYQPIEEDEEVEENQIQDLIHQARNTLQFETDAKAEALLKKYKALQQQYQNPELKILVFTEYRSTQKMLFDFFNLNAYRTTFINGGQSLDDRKIALAEYRDTAQIMVATDAAGESLNMQFCHIVFNYDLPWNPMMIEQRIGRVDRIGQKQKVQAFNMLTDNSVDMRVYQIIEEKLNVILHQLGIDKTSDVLDSTLDIKGVNQLYLESLLNPERFEFYGDKWLHEIKSKLRDFQSTEGILPAVEASEIDPNKASQVKHSPLPIWLEDLVSLYVRNNGGLVQKTLEGYLEISLEKQKRKISFDKEIAINHPNIENMSFQSDWIQSILNSLEYLDSEQKVPVLQSKI